MSKWNQFLVITANQFSSRCKSEFVQLILSETVKLCHPAELIVTMRTQELKRKDSSIEKQGARMSEDIATLQSEIASLQVIYCHRQCLLAFCFGNLMLIYFLPIQSKGSVAAGESTDKADTWAIELANQVGGNTVYRILRNVYNNYSSVISDLTASRLRSSGMIWREGRAMQRRRCKS